MTVPDEVYDLVRAEVNSQDHQWGEDRSHPDGTSADDWGLALKLARKQMERESRVGPVTWQKILFEEICEAFCEEEPKPLEEELVQSAAVIMQWVADIRRRKKNDH